MKVYKNDSAATRIFMGVHRVTGQRFVVVNISTPGAPFEACEFSFPNATMLGEFVLALVETGHLAWPDIVPKVSE